MGHGVYVVVPGAMEGASDAQLLQVVLAGPLGVWVREKQAPPQAKTGPAYSTVTIIIHDNIPPPQTGTTNAGFIDSDSASQ